MADNPRSLMWQLIYALLIKADTGSPRWWLVLPLLTFFAILLWNKLPDGVALAEILRELLR